MTRWKESDKIERKVQDGEMAAENKEKKEKKTL